MPVPSPVPSHGPSAGGRRRTSVFMTDDGGGAQGTKAKMHEVAFRNAVRADTSAGTKILAFLMVARSTRAAAWDDVRTAVSDLLPCIDPGRFSAKLREDASADAQRRRARSVTAAPRRAAPQPRLSAPRRCATAPGRLAALCCRFSLARLFTVGLSYNFIAVALLTCLLLATQGAVLVATSTFNTYVELLAGLVIISMSALTLASEALLAIVACSWYHYAIRQFPPVTGEDVTLWEQLMIWRRVTPVGDAPGRRAAAAAARTVRAPGSLPSIEEKRSAAPTSAL